MPGSTYLSGDAVELRTVEEEDVETLTRLVNDRAVRRYVHRFRTPYTTENFEEEFRNVGGEGAMFVIWAEGDRVGHASLAPIHEDRRCANLGCLVFPDHQGNGYATEACELLLEYGFSELLLHRIGARALASNASARHVLETLGLTEEGRKREVAIADGDYVDQVVYGVLRREWRDEGRPADD